MTFRFNPLFAAIALVSANMALADHAPLEQQDMAETLVTAADLSSAPGHTRLTEKDFAYRRAASSDTSSLLRDIPGVSVYGAGGVSGLPAIRGLADDRLRIQVDGMDLVSACGNHMNPPLSYIDPSDVATIEVFAGITPVSVGGDSIGGTIIVNSPSPVFATEDDDTVSSGSVGTFYRSNGNGFGANLSATAANSWLSVRYSGAYAKSDNYHSADDFKPAGPAAAGRGWLDGDEVGSSAYETQNHKLGVALQRENHLFDFELGYQYIPEQGFTNQRMDMTSNTSTQGIFRYTGEYSWGKLSGRAYHERTRHKMNFGDDKLFWYGPNNIPDSDGVPGPISGGPNGYAAGMPMDTEGKNTGALLSADINLNKRDLLRVGGELQFYDLDDWWDPSGKGMWPNTFWNISDGERDRYALFGEWQARWNDEWLTMVGVRSETVKMDTGDVQGYGLMPAGELEAAAFNAQDHSHTDNNWDVSLQARYTPTQTQTYEFGMARKTRSPNLYERYSWSTGGMAMRMVNMAGDGNGYVGNLELEPEVANTLSIAGDWHDQGRQHWQLIVTPFVTYVEDYIDATPCTASMCEMSNNMPGFRYLTFANDDALLYGVDVSGFRHLAKIDGIGSFTARGLLNYVRGENRTTDDKLYNIMPLNAKLTLEHELGEWTNVAELVLVSAKDDTSAVRNELETAGYGLLNLRSSYLWKSLRVDIGLENALNKQYDLPLGGAYMGQGKTMSPMDVPYGVAVPGMGRSLYAGLNYEF
jgi:iron complex outermembrane receptor protein